VVGVPILGLWGLRGQEKKTALDGAEHKTVKKYWSSYDLIRDFYAKKNAH
jgi:hypothetical protein